MPSLKETKIIDRFSNGEKDVTHNCKRGHSRQKWETGTVQPDISAKTAALLAAVN